MRLIIFFLIGVVLTLASCGTSKETALEQVISDIIKGKVQKTIFNDEKSDSTTCAIDYSFFAPSKMVYRDSVNQKIKKHVARFTQLEIGAMDKLTLSNSFFQAQLDSFAFLCASEDDYDEDMNHLWELESIIEIEDSREIFVQLQITAWSYTGGAHGNGATRTWLVDKVTAKDLLLEDVFSDLDVVTAIGESYFRKLHELEPDANLDDAGFWFENNRFHLNDNFSIVGDKIVFLYNSYEIAPYSAGETVIEMQLEEIRNYLKIKI
jgi:hypothetical protein